MIYDAHATLAIPAGDAQLLATAKACSRAIDPDVGGDKAFAVMAETTGQPIIGFGGAETPNPSVAHQEWYVYGSPMTSETAGNIQAFKTNPALLHGAIAAIYAERWPGEAPPALADCQAFCGAVLLSSAYGVVAGCNDLGLEIIVVEP